MNFVNCQSFLRTVNVKIRKNLYFLDFFRDLLWSAEIRSQCRRPPAWVFVTYYCITPPRPPHQLKCTYISDKWQIKTNVVTEGSRGNTVTGVNLIRIWKTSQNIKSKYYAVYDWIILKYNYVSHLLIKLDHHSNILIFIPSTLRFFHKQTDDLYFDYYMSCFKYLDLRRSYFLEGTFVIFPQNFTLKSETRAFWHIYYDTESVPH